MVKLFAILMAFVFFGYSMPQGECLCRKASPNDFTYHSGEQIRALKTHKVGLVRGQVFDASTSNNPAEGVLVELFPDPKLGHPISVAALLQALNHNDSNENRVAACWTGKDGGFCFNNTPSGKYALLISKRGQPLTFGLVVVDSQKASSDKDEIRVVMRSGS